MWTTSWMMVILLLLLVMRLPPTSSFPHQQNPHHAAISGTPITTRGLLASSSSSKGPGPNLALPSLFDNGNAASISEASSGRKPSELWRSRCGFFLMTAAFYGCCWGGIRPPIAEAASPESAANHSQRLQQPYSSVVVPKEGGKPAATTTATSSSSRLVATYASEGKGGLPFLSPFQVPGATPQPPPPMPFGAAAADNLDREARNRAYDDAFDQDKRDRDAYYGKMALQKREQALAEARERRSEIGLNNGDNDDAGPRLGDANVASMASLTKYLLQKDPSTMRPAELQELQLLQQRGKTPTTIVP